MEGKSRRCSICKETKPVEAVHKNGVCKYCSQFDGVTRRRKHRENLAAMGYARPSKERLEYRLELDAILGPERSIFAPLPIVYRGFNTAKG